MKELKDGYVPSEIRKKYPNGADVGIEDKRDEEYVPPPPPAYIAYSGHGASVGHVKGVGLEVNKESGKPVCDETKPKTRIQFRFHNGQREVVEFNTDHTVADIHTYVMQAAPVDGDYELLSGFPPKPLDNPDITIEGAGLSGGAITQKIV